MFKSLKFLNEGFDRKYLKEEIEEEIFHNDNGTDYVVVERSKSGKNALLRTQNGKKWIVAWDCPKSNEGSWGQGHYFFDEHSARDLWEKDYLNENCNDSSKSKKKKTNENGLHLEKIEESSSYYDEYTHIIDRIKNARSIEELHDIDEIINRSRYAKDARRGDANNYMSLQTSLVNRMNELKSSKSKKNESLNESTEDLYNVWVFENTSGRNRGFTPDTIEDFIFLPDINDNDLIELFINLDYIYEDDNGRFPTIEDCLDSLETHDFTDGGPIIYRVEKNGKEIYDNSEYFEELKASIEDEIDSYLDESLNEAANEYTVVVSRRGRDKEVSGTLDYLIDYFKYTLEKGYSWQNEKGRKKIDKHPKTIKSLVTNLNNAENNAAANGYSGTSYSLKESLTEDEKSNAKKVKELPDSLYWFLQDVAQETGAITYKDIPRNVDEYTNRCLLNAKRRYQRAANNNDEKRCNDIGEEVAKILKGSNESLNESSRTWAEEKYDELIEKGKDQWDEDDWDAYHYIMQVWFENGYFDESLTEDTVKQNGKWVNKGKEGTHGKFATKKSADAQRKAMFANGYKAESLPEGIDVKSTGKDKMPLYMAMDAVKKFNDDAKAYPYWVIKTDKWYDPEGLNIPNKGYNIEYAGTYDECNNKLSQLINSVDDDWICLDKTGKDFVTLYYPHAIAKVTFSIIKNPSLIVKKGV